MTYYADKVTNIQVDTIGRFPIIRASVAEGYDYVQIYQAGALVGSAQVTDFTVEFVGAVPGSIDPIFLLAVDQADVETDFFTDAFPETAAQGNRIQVSVQTDETYLIGYKWRITLDAAVVHEADVFPSGQGAGGWGFDLGGSWGDGPLGVGWSSVWGAHWGADPVVLEWTSEVLTNGTYTIIATILDSAGNESSDTSENVTIATYARPATDFAIDGYVQGTDTLSLTWTESPDI